VFLSACLFVCCGTAASATASVYCETFSSKVKRRRRRKRMKKKNL
jgi:hypothetical protein